MNTIIRNIRSCLELNQKEFGALLGVTFATVNRWENGHSVPKQKMQEQIYLLCKENNLPVYDMILEKIKNIQKSIEPAEEHILLYHGSKSGIEGPIRPQSRKQCDFGKGFYMGTDPSQALALICDFEQSKFYIMDLDMTGLKHSEVPPDIDWAMLVAYHRGKMEKIKGTPLYKKYSEMSSGKDLVIGNIANDRMFFVIDNFFQGAITDVALVNSLSVLELGKQYVVVTEKGCEHVRIAAEIPLSHLERLCMKEVAVSNRDRGVSLANDICKNYRREGQFFDELLEAAGG